MDLRVQKILSLAAGILFILPVYILLHEGGHALIALLCGAREAVKYSVSMGMKPSR